MTKGPFKPSEISHYKRMSGSRSCMTHNQGRMSGHHGQGGKSHNNNMDHNTGGYRIGKNDPTFKHANYYQAGPRPSYPKHHGQPRGHKKQAGPN